MNSTLNMLLRFGISVGLQDRDAFVNKVGNLLQEKMGTNEYESQKIGEKILVALDTIKDQLVLDQFLAGVSKKNKSLERQLKELVKAIKDIETKIDNKE